MFATLRTVRENYHYFSAIIDKVSQSSVDSAKVGCDLVSQTNAKEYSDYSLAQNN